MPDEVMRDRGRDRDDGCNEVVGAVRDECLQHGELHAHPEQRDDVESRETSNDPHDNFSARCSARVWLMVRVAKAARRQTNAIPPPTSNTRMDRTKIVVSGLKKIARFPIDKRMRSSVGPNPHVEMLNVPTQYVARNAS